MRTGSVTDCMVMAVLDDREECYETHDCRGSLIETIDGTPSPRGGLFASDGLERSKQAGTRRTRR
ncbi:MAG: hypothetical protein WA182_13860 [Candidatus Sulfotelmatobacter sp.]